MTDITSIARPYAKAAFEFALEHQALDTWSLLLQHVAAIVLDPGCLTFISNPGVVPAQHTQLLLATLERFDGGKDNVYFREFISLLARNKRLLALPNISELYAHYKAAYEKTLTVDVCSFSSLTKEQLGKLGAQLSKRLQRQVTLAVSIDKNLLGGAIIRAGNLVFDGSVRTQLKKLSRNLAAFCL